MAITNTAGVIFADSEGTAATVRTKVTYLIYSSSNATAEIILRDGVTDTSPIKLKLHLNAANTTKQLDFSRLAIVFQNGIFCDNIVSGDSISIVTTTAGSNT